MKTNNHKKRWQILLVFIVLGFVTYAAFSKAAMLSNQDQKMTASAEGKINEGNTICPVLGEKIDEGTNVNVEYKGKIYNLCCSGCIEEFEKDPQKYVLKFKDIKLEAFQFEFSPNVITVKKGDIVKILALSRDVAHGIYIKEYSINAQIKKGKNVNIEFLANKAGTFDIICSVYCGKGHKGMKAKLIVE